MGGIVIGGAAGGTVVVVVGTFEATVVVDVELAKDVPELRRVAERLRDLPVELQEEVPREELLLLLLLGLLLCSGRCRASSTPTAS